MKPLVSICCITYNHEKYIADALDSFLMQETSFPYEIIVHDDASTDETAKIIREYEKKYPDIIVSIYQTENQYSKGKKPLKDFAIPLVRGKYIATCEGDDFWTDVKKLQKQVKFLEDNHDCLMCFHAVKVVDINKNFLGRYLGLLGKGTREITISEAARGGMIHVSSKVYRTKFYSKERPKWITNALHGDYALALYPAAEGRVCYIDEVMSSHRTGVENSVMTKIKENYSKENDIKYHLNRIETLNIADKYYDFQFHNEIGKVKLTSKVIILLLENDYSASARSKYGSYIDQNGITAFIKLFLLKKLPTIANILAKFKGKISLRKMIR